MKVLFIIPYFYESSKNEFTRNKTGFGFLLKDIACHGARLDDIYVLSSVITSGFIVDGINVISHKWVDIFKHIKPRYFLQALRGFFIPGLSLRDRLRHLFYSFDLGYSEYIIKTLKPEIVHFHTVGYRTEQGMEICKKLNQKYMLTLHGLVGFVDDSPNHLKESEKKLLQELNYLNKPVTVISTGIKNRINELYGINTNNITVITNGTKQDFSSEQVLSLNIRKRHEIPEEAKIIVCVGNVCRRKNQVQLIRAYELLDDKVKEGLYILLLGNIDKELKLERLVENNDHVKLCGFINKDELPSYFDEADYNAVVSMDEGFGLSIIEAFTYGLPTVSFPDLDAIPDLYSDRAMVLSAGRNDKDLADAIERLCNTVWDAQFIKDYSRNFSLGRMSEKYHNVYIKTLSEG